MKRAYPITAALVVASLGSLWALNACARDAEQPRRVAAANPAESVGKWTAGTNYTVLPNPQPTRVKPGKVEVNEFFWYGCSHCYSLDPALESWQQNKPAFIEFARVPVMWGPIHQQHAKLFYTLLELKRADLHAKVFDAIHKDHNMLGGQTDAEARALHQAFFEANGVSAKDFSAAYDSMTVAASVQRAHEVTYRYGISSVPLVSVNGKYTTDVTMAGGAGPLLTLINDLAASEKKR